MGGERAGGGFALTLPRCEAAVEDGRAALLAWLEPFALDARVLNRVEVVLEELVSNIVRHADAADRVSIAAECSGEALSLSVEDNGAPFNPFEMAERERFRDLDTAELGGLGIPLIKRLSRTVSYERVGGANRVTAEIAA